MVTVKKTFPREADGSVNLAAWLTHFRQYPHLQNNPLIEQAARFAATRSQGLTTFYGQPCLEQGLEMADLLLEMQLDADTAAAAIMTGTARQTHLDEEMLTTAL